MPCFSFFCVSWCWRWSPGPHATQALYKWAVSSSPCVLFLSCWKLCSHPSFFDFESFISVAKSSCWNCTKQSCLFFFFSRYSGVELRGSPWLGRHATSWATLPVLFALVVFELEFWSLYAWAGLDCHPPICVSQRRWDHKCTCHLTQLLVEMGSCELFVWAGL
jgi:hypothetical protein